MKRFLSLLASGVVTLGASQTVLAQAGPQTLHVQNIQFHSGTYSILLQPPAGLNSDFVWMFPLPPSGSAQPGFLGIGTSAGQYPVWAPSGLTGSWNATSPGDLITSTTGLTIRGGSGAVMGSGASIDIAAASASQNGLLSSSDWQRFDAAYTAIGSGSYIPTYSLSTSGPLTINGGSSASNVVVGTSVDIEIPYAGSSGSSGLLSGSDWANFQAAYNAIGSGSSITTGDLTTTSTSGITFDGSGTSLSHVLVGSTHSIDIQIQDGSYPAGLISGADWLNFYSAYLAVGSNATSVPLTGGTAVSFSGGSANILSTGGSYVEIDLAYAGSGSAGILSSTDWNTFNNKIGNDVTESGTASFALRATATNVATSTTDALVGVVNSSSTTTATLGAGVMAQGAGGANYSNGLIIKDGAFGVAGAAPAGQATINVSAGAATITNQFCRSNSYVIVTPATAQSATDQLYISATANGSFSVTAAAAGPHGAADVINYLIITPTGR